MNIDTKRELNETSNIHDQEITSFDKRLNEVTPTKDGGEANQEMTFDKRLNTQETKIDEERINDTMDSFLNKDIWDHLSVEEKMDRCIEVKNYYSNKLQLTENTKIGFYNKNDHCYGYYDSMKRNLVLNTRYFGDGKETLDTIIHEMRHIWQFGRMDLPENQKNDFDKLLTENNQDYILPQDNYRAYQAQPTEMDAMLYSKNEINKYIEGGKQ